MTFLGVTWKRFKDPLMSWSFLVWLENASKTPWCPKKPVSHRHGFFLVWLKNASKTPWCPGLSWCDWKALQRFPDVPRNQTLAQHYGTRWKVVRAGTSPSADDGLAEPEERVCVARECRRRRRRRFKDAGLEYPAVESGNVAEGPANDDVSGHERSVRCEAEGNREHVGRNVWHILLLISTTVFSQ